MNDFPTKNTFNSQVKLRQQQVWMGQLLDFVFKHGGLHQYVSTRFRDG